jgi:hypothetical protein
MTHAISIRMMTAASSMEAFRSANAAWKNPHPPEKQHAAKKAHGTPRATQGMLETQQIDWHSERDVENRYKEIEKSCSPISRGCPTPGNVDPFGQTTTLLAFNIYDVSITLAPATHPIFFDRVRCCPVVIFL